MDHAWTCRCCGKQYNSLPLDFGFDAPHHWLVIPQDERSRFGELDSDVCRIEDDIFVRGVIEIPITGLNEPFRWGAWTSVSAESFTRILDLWNAPVIENEPPKFGWLCNTISVYPDTLHLRTNLYLRSGNKRPLIELDPTDHPLAIEQRQGISIERVEEIVTALSPRH